MKVVLFCGGYGMRMRGSEHDDVPKPMQLVGSYPLLWHIMRYFAHFGHNDFILCLGYGAKHITNYFLDRSRSTEGDFVLRGNTVTPISDPTEDWRITFAHTGIDAPIGERLRRVRQHLQGEEMFLANYADVLTDADLNSMINRFSQTEDAVASVMSVPPAETYHALTVDAEYRVTAITPASAMPVRVNGGFIILRQEIFDYLHPGEDLIGDAYGRLAAERRALAQPYDGFWMAADTFKERAELDRMWRSGDSPWAVWREDHLR